MKDTKSLLLILLSVGLISTWVYHLYDKSIYEQNRPNTTAKDSTAFTEGIRDSLMRLYSQNIKTPEIKPDSSSENYDSTKNQLQEKLKEIYRLRNEIGSILKNRNATKADLIVARSKIAELEQRVQELQNTNVSIEEEKKQLSNSLDQVNSQVSSLEQSVKKVNEENSDLKEKVNIASTFIASGISLSAINVRGSKEHETSSLKKTDKFVISFTVQNNIVQEPAAQVFIVIIQPDGQIFRNNVWESGSFLTRTKERKDFTAEIRFDYVKGDQSKQAFSLEADELKVPGDYTLQIWNKGVLIGQVVKKLN
ncbi:MAG: hypothetical protein JST17_00095 [Bacteroidetes bacterium]|nr:hypothetical protein [Bacteroidota bacterium]MBS1932215.1 hypothetical protein [Bacteroidota bacterium]